MELLSPPKEESEGSTSVEEVGVEDDDEDEEGVDMEVEEGVEREAKGDSMLVSEEKLW